MKGEKGDSNSFALRPASPKCFMLTLYKISDYSKVSYFEYLISVDFVTSWTTRPLKMGPMGCLETSAWNYYSTLHDIPKESSSCEMC